MGFGVLGLGFGAWGLGVEVWGLGLGVWGLNLDTHRGELARDEKGIELKQSGDEVFYTACS